MKYSELISFKPIESTIQLLETADKSAARDAVSTYVMSDSMAEGMKAPVIDQLQMEEVVDNKAIMVVGNFGTGKSHLMSVIAAVATDSDELNYLQNKKFAEDMEIIAGKFEVLRMKVDGLTMPLREIIMGEIEDDFTARGIDYQVPELDKVRDNSRIIKDAMAKFQRKYPEKGYLIVIDELLSYLTSRDERQIILDLAFLQSMAEMCSKSRLRVVCGVQEKVFDNPRFSFVSETLKKVGDRFTQIIITKEATAYVVSERILKKTPEQKAMIRNHLEKFTNLYSGMSSRLEEFVDLFPIHPAYIDVFNRIYLIENRHILKNISTCIRKIFDTDVPETAPGVISFDDYWTAIKTNGLLRSDPTIGRVVNVSQQLEDIIKRAFSKPAYKPLAIQIIYALSVHRLTTNGLDVQFGMTAENLKDDLCLYLPMPEQDAEFLLGAVNATLRAIMTTVSGQFIIYNDANNQYFIDVNKIVDYDEKIRQKASVMADSDLNRYFYDVVYTCLEWDAKQYVTNFNIYEYTLNWASHNMYREGYLFMGLPGERSTAQPERDFYIHIMPPYENTSSSAASEIGNLKDEVYLFFKSSADFKEILGLYAAAKSLAEISEGKDKDAYQNKAVIHRKKLVKNLSENKNTCFDLCYDHQKKQLIEVLRGKYNRDLTFKDTIDLASSIVLDGYFDQKYSEYPVMRTKITRKNYLEMVRAAYDYFAGRKTQPSALMLQSFGVLDGDKIRPEGSKYALYYIDQIKKLPHQGVLNFSDLFEEVGIDEYADRKFHISYDYMPIVFLSMVYAGYAVITLQNNKMLTASTLDQIPRITLPDLRQFKYITRPAEMAIAELKHLFEVLGLNPALLINPKDRNKGVEDLCARTKELANLAVTQKRKLTDGFTLWGEPLVNESQMYQLQDACDAVRDEFSNYAVRFNTAAKLNNFQLSMDEIDKLANEIRALSVIGQYVTFRTECADITGYISNIEYFDLGDSLKAEIGQAKTLFREARDSILQGIPGDVAAQKVTSTLTKIKEKYISAYFKEHQKKRLNVVDAKRRANIQQGRKMANIKKLRGIEMLPTIKLSSIEQDLSSMRVCYELMPEMLKTSHICPFCGFKIDKHEMNVFGRLDNIEKRISDLQLEWTQTLIDTIHDPIVENQKEYLTEKQKDIINTFLKSGSLPERVDDSFVNAIRALLQGFEPVIIDSNELIQKIESLPPLEERIFLDEFKRIIDIYTKGKNDSRVRIIIKRNPDKDDCI